jgi:hypothetical protein
MPKSSPDALLEIVHLRVSNASEPDAADDIMGLDLTGGVLNNEDKELVADAQVAIGKQRQERSELQTKVKEKRASVGSSGARAKAGASKGGDTKKWKGIKQCPPGSITQEEASGMCPPGGHIWRNRTGGAWCGHLPPHRRISATWLQHGHREAAIWVLQQLWNSYLQNTSDSCPVKGLMPTPAPAASSAAATSSAAASSGGPAVEPPAKKARK